MKAQDLALSIIEFNIKQNAAKYAASKHESIRKEGLELYGSFKAFSEYYKKHEQRDINFYISEKQATWLISLMQHEGLKEISIENFKARPVNPMVATSAYGGFVGKKADTSRWILKIIPQY